MFEGFGVLYRLNFFMRRERHVGRLSGSGASMGVRVVLKV